MKAVSNRFEIAPPSLGKNITLTIEYADVFVLNFLRQKTKNIHLFSVDILEN